MAKFPPPTPELIPARYHGGRQTPKAIVLHGTVSPDDPGTARNVAKWWNGPTSPKTSAQYVVDPLEVIQCVGDHTIAFHCGYNTNTIGVEFCDEQAGPATRWADEDSKAILKRGARLVAELCLAYGIDPKRPTIAELKAKGPHGIYGHNDSRLAFGHTTHMDPLDFPWPRFMAATRAQIKNIKSVAAGNENRRKVRIHTVHTSMQFSDSTYEKRSDVEKIFTRAKSRKVRFITGTEAGRGQSQNLRDALREAGRRFGFAVRFYGDTWVAINKVFIVPDTKLEVYSERITEKVVGRFTPKAVFGVTYQDVDMGETTVMAGHYATKGKPSAKNPEYRANVRYNRALARGIGEYATVVGKGRSKVFYGGDQNIVDRIDDTFFDQPLTSLWDELGTYQNTGHGNIDVLASYDRDSAVSGAYCRVLNDGEFPLNTDHFMVEGGFDVYV